MTIAFCFVTTIKTTTYTKTTLLSQNNTNYDYL